MNLFRQMKRDCYDAKHQGNALVYNTITDFLRNYDKIKDVTDAIEECIAYKESFADNNPELAETVNAEADVLRSCIPAQMHINTAKGLVIQKAAETPMANAAYLYRWMCTGHCGRFDKAELLAYINENYS